MSVSVNVLAFVQIWPLRLSRMTAHCNRHMGSIYPSNAHLEGRGGRRGNFRYGCLDPTYSLSSQWCFLMRIFILGGLSRPSWQANTDRVYPFILHQPNFRFYSLYWASLHLQYHPSMKVEVIWHCLSDIKTWEIWHKIWIVWSKVSNTWHRNILSLWNSYDSRPGLCKDSLNLRHFL